MEQFIENAKDLYGLEEYELYPVPSHEGGRNLVLVCVKNGIPERVLRFSLLGDKRAEDFLSEAEFVHYLAENGAPVVDVIPSVNGKLVETFSLDGKECFVMLFSYANGMLLFDNGYRYREGAPLEEYFYNTGKTLGAIHRLAKEYKPVNRRPEYFDKYNREYIDELISDEFAELKTAIGERLDEFRKLPMDENVYGLVHFDFSDGNYHIDMNTGDITVFDFDNSMYCWYMFDLANLWIHGTGWYQQEPDGAKRLEYMKGYFDTILAGYRSETTISDEETAQLQLFIDMVLIENIVDEFECCAREGEEPDPEDIEDAAECLIHHIPYAGFGEM
ncbi:MAG: phosphotransferase [Lachnospiraceae bacterium]|nr:phosphotransferase [Lachnospiraceae bacterium]